MRHRSLLCAALLLAGTAYAKEPKAYQDGQLLQMDSVQCGTDSEGAKIVATHEVVCQEYVVQTDQVVYRVRPKDDKHADLLPIGERAKFRLEKNIMLLQPRVADSREREYVVVSIKPRGDSTADAGPTHVNHLQ